MATQLEPIEVFNVLKHVPALNAEFRTECYSYPENDSLDFTTSEGEKRYNHKLGIAFLKKHGIPTTREALKADGKYTYTSIKDGTKVYNVGQFIVVFSNAIYSSGDITNNNVWVLEVMDEFEFLADLELTSLVDEDIREALKVFLDTGKVKLHQAGHRIYDVEFSYKFAERINSEDEGDGQ